MKYSLKEAPSDKLKLRDQAKIEIIGDEYLMKKLNEIHQAHVLKKEQNPDTRNNSKFTNTKEKIFNRFVDFKVENGSRFKREDDLIKSFCASEEVVIDKDLQKINSSFTLPSVRSVAGALLILNQILQAGAPVAPPPPDCSGRQQSGGNANCGILGSSASPSTVASQTSLAIGTTTALASSVMNSNSTSYLATSAKFLAQANASAILHYNATPSIANNYSPPIIANNATPSIANNDSTPIVEQATASAPAAPVEPSASASAAPVEPSASAPVEPPASTSAPVEPPASTSAPVEPPASTPAQAPASNPGSAQGSDNNVGLIAGAAVGGVAAVGAAVAAVVWCKRTGLGLNPDAAPATGQVQSSRSRSLATLVNRVSHQV
jgi:hypothetical protein